MNFPFPNKNVNRVQQKQSSKQYGVFYKNAKYIFRADYTLSCIPMCAISFDENSKGGSWQNFYSQSTPQEKNKKKKKQEKSSESDQYSLFEL